MLRSCRAPAIVWADWERHLAPKAHNRASSETPRYLQVAAELRAEILSGKFAARDQFPTESELTQRYAVSRFTVREALRLVPLDLRMHVAEHRVQVVAGERLVRAADDRLVHTRQPR